MMKDIITGIRDQQMKRRVPSAELAVHKPEMLYIGCVDARLDPIEDIGIPKGKALIYRNIAALVRPSAQNREQSVNAADALSSGEIPESVSVGAALEFFLNHIEIPASGKKHIVVSGHTDCGGIRACLEGVGEHDHYLPQYLSALSDVRESVLANKDLVTLAERRQALEEASVRQSIENLMSYDVVRQAVEAGEVELHGWVLNTANCQIKEMGEDGKFRLLVGVESQRGR